MFRAQVWLGAEVTLGIFFRAFLSCAFTYLVNVAWPAPPPKVSRCCMAGLLLVFGLPALLATGCSASLWVLLMGAPSSSCFQNHVLPFLLPLCLQGKILEKQNAGERRPWSRWMQRGAVGTELLYQQETHPQRPVLHPTGHQPPCLQLCEQEGLGEIGVQIGVDQAS